jgi:hypothetical protein
MKKIICAVCLIIPLPFIWISLLMRYGEREGNFGNGRKEYPDGRETPWVKVFQEKEMWSGWTEKDYEGIHSISFCKEWKDGKDGENPVTVVRVVRTGRR